MKFKVKIITEIEIDWNGDNCKDEAENARDLFLHIKEYPIRFMELCPEPEIIFVGVTKC